MVLELAGESKMIKRNHMLKVKESGRERESEPDRVSWPVWLIWCDRKKSTFCVSLHYPGQIQGVCFMQTDEFQKWNPGFLWIQNCQRVLPFRHIHLLLCLVSCRLFILAFISAITAMPVRSIRGKWKTAVILRYGLKVTSCGETHMTPFVRLSWYILLWPEHSAIKVHPSKY